MYDGSTWTSHRQVKCFIVDDESLLSPYMLNPPNVSLDCRTSLSFIPSTSSCLSDSFARSPSHGRSTRHAMHTRTVGRLKSVHRWQVHVVSRSRSGKTLDFGGKGVKPSGATKMRSMRTEKLSRNWRSRKSKWCLVQATKVGKKLSRNRRRGEDYLHSMVPFRI